MTLIEKMEALRNNKEGEDILDKMLIYRHNEAIDKCIAIVKNANLVSLPCKVGERIAYLYDEGYGDGTKVCTAIANFALEEHQISIDFTNLVYRDNKWFVDVGIDLTGIIFFGTNARAEAEAKLEGEE